MVPKFMCKRHQCRGSSESHRSKGGEQRGHGVLEMIDLLLSVDLHEQPSRLLRCPRVGRPRCVELQQRRLNSERRTNRKDKIRYLDLRNSELVQPFEECRIGRESEHPRLVTAGGSLGDLIWHKFYGHRSNLSLTSDKNTHSERQYLESAYGQRPTVNGEAMEHRRGIWFGLAAYVLWGLTPIYWNLVSTDAVSLLLHRIIWSVPILFLIVTERRQWPVFRDGYATWRPRLTTAFAGVLLTINWGLYVWSVTNGHIVEASLGYFINPLVSVALGVIVLNERLNTLQWTAVGIAALGVTLMGVLAGVPPWISLTLAFSFGLYGLLKKRDITPPPVVSLFGETLVLFLPALFILLFMAEPDGATFGASPSVTIFFIGGGLVTVIPLLLFGASAKRIPLATLGFLQYVAPTLQLLVGVIVFNESMTTAEIVGFGAVWIALLIFVWTGMRRQTGESTPTRLIADT